MSAPHSRDVPRNRLAATKADLDRKVDYGDAIHASNPFGGHQLYIADLDNTIYLADKRWFVTAEIQRVSDGSPVMTVDPAALFDGNYESNIAINPGEQLDLHIRFSEDGTGVYPGGYAYGVLYASFYAAEKPASLADVNMRVYCNHPAQGIEWKTLPKENIASGDSFIVAFEQKWYGLSDIHLTIKNTNTQGGVRVTHLDHYNDRPQSNPKVVLSKYRPESMYQRTSWESGRVVNAYIDPSGSAKFGTIDSPSITAKQDKPTSGTASATTYLRGDGTWATPTNTTYSVMSEAEATAGTASTARTLSAAVLKAAIAFFAEKKAWQGTQAQYDALGTYDSNRTYYITD